MDLTLFAHRLTRAMHARRMSPGTLAIVSGCHEKTIYKYLRGECMPKADAVYKLALALMVSMDWLTGLDEKLKEKKARREGGAGNARAK